MYFLQKYLEILSLEILHLSTYVERSNCHEDKNVPCHVENRIVNLFMVYCNQYIADCDT